MDFNIYIISYKSDLRDSIKGNFLILDNTDNERPEWREYWPIRNYLLNNSLDENSYYAFFSPRFEEKTGISYQELMEILIPKYGEYDALIFSHQFDIGAFFQNVFYGGELMSPGFLDCAQRVFDRNKMNLSVGDLVMDSRVTIFSNYVVAKPKFWKEWLRIGEMFFSIAESSNVSDKLKDELNRPTTYQGLPRKTFMCEGMSGLILKLNPNFKTYRHDSFGMPYAWSAQLGSYKTEALCCDALKTAIIEHPRKQYYEAFRKLSRDVLIKAKLITEDTYMHRAEVYDPLDETLLGAIPKNSKYIIEVGSGRGVLANAYRQNNSDTAWIGVDSDEDFFHAASVKMDSYLVKNLDSLDQDFIFQHRSADVWILNNALERMQDPWQFLENLASVFNIKTCLIINIKNFQHWYFQSQVVSGKLRYDDTSSFCKSHVRLFNRSMLLEMLDAAGFQMNHGVGVRKEHSDPSKYINGIRVMAQAAGVDEQLAVSDAMSDSYVISALLKQ